MEQNYPVWENVQFLNATASGEYSYQCGLNGHFNLPHRRQKPHSL
jgi:hypothetical protein